MTTLSEVRAALLTFTVMVSAAGLAAQHGHGSEGVGTAHMETSCLPAAQAKFDRALALLVGHVAGALAAAMPATADAEPALALRWWRPTAVIAGATAATAGLVAVLDAWSPRGSLVVVLAALVVAGLGTWWWSTSGEP